VRSWVLPPGAGLCMRPLHAPAMQHMSQEYPQSVLQAYSNEPSHIPCTPAACLRDRRPPGAPARRAARPARRAAPRRARPARRSRRRRAWWRWCGTKPGLTRHARRMICSSCSGERPGGRRSSSLVAAASPKPALRRRDRRGAAGGGSVERGLLTIEGPGSDWVGHMCRAGVAG
jgi:hypothetical protein